MKYLKLFESFELIQEGSITFGEIKDIFLPVSDHGLPTQDSKVGNFCSMGDKKIIDNHKEFDMSNTFKGIMVRLGNGNFSFTDELFEDLESSIEHFESRCNCQLDSIFVRVPGGQWFSDTETLKNHVKEGHEYYIDTGMILFIDLVFRP